MKAFNLITIITILINLIVFSGWFVQAWGIQKRVLEIPETITINLISKKYHPVIFPHRIHSEISERCQTCHHHNNTDEILRCSVCHEENQGLKKEDIPSLKAAYHLQCLDCHKQQDVELARCTFCHARK